jgi:hypothetical protein
VAYWYGSIKIGKKNMKNIQLLLLMLSFLSGMTSCQPALKEFQPEKDSLFKITFSYPAIWDWEEDIPFDDFIGVPPPSERIILQNGSLDNGSIAIQVYYETSTSLAKIKEGMDTFSGDSAYTVLSDTILQIDGYDARWFTLSGVAYSAQGTIAIQPEIIYLFTEDRYYTIDLDILESERDGDFHKRFEDLVKSIKVLP